MTKKRLVEELEASIKRAKRQKDDLYRIDTRAVKNASHRAIMEVLRHNAIFIANGRIQAYRDVLRKLKWTGIKVGK